MKHKTLIFITLSAAVCAATMYAQIPLKSWLRLPVITARQPLLIDSLDAKGISYNCSQLLDTKHLRSIRNSSTEVVMANDSNTITMPRAEEGKFEIYEYATPIRAARYAEGTIEVTASGTCKLYINDEEKASNVATGSETFSTRITLEPEADYELRLRILIDSQLPKSDFKVIFTPDEKFKDVKITSQAGMKRHFALADTEFGGRVSGMSISPDGTNLITTITEKHSPTVYESKTILKDLKTGKETWLGQADAIQWMPRSNKLSIALKNNDTYDIYILDPKDGSRTLMAQGFPQASYAWDINEQKIYYQTSDEGKKDSGPLRRYSSPDDRIPGNRDLTQIAVFDPSTGVSTQLTRGSRSSILMGFHPDGNRLLLMTTAINPKEWPFTENSLYEYNPTTGAVDTIIAKSGFLVDASYSPDGSRLLIAAAAQEFGGIADRSNAPIANSYDQQLYILNRNNGDIDPITIDFDPTFNSKAIWNHADGKIYFRAVKGFGDRVFCYNPKTRKINELPLQIENITDFDMGINAATIAYRGMSRDHIGEGRLYNIKTGKDISIADPDAERLAEIELSKLERWTFTASDGTEIEGYAAYPPEFDPTKKYPMIVYYYGGTLPTQFTLSSPYNPQLAASRGYVVYMLNPSGTIGYGQEFSARHVNAWGKRTAEDIIEGTKQFVTEHPFVNPDKIGCIGASYGGFMTQYLQTLTDIFAAAVSHAGISNVTSYWGEGYWGYSYNAVAAAKSYPWQNPELFTKQGSLFNADKIHTPLLLLHGTADTNVPTGESIQLFNALKILGREVELVTVDGENHFISDYNKRKQWNDTYMAWFAKWLQDDPRWWNALYPDK